MQPDPPDGKFAALADPTRWAILARLAYGEATVGEHAAPFAMSQPSISQHLNVLEAAGFSSRNRVAQTRPCRLEPNAMKAVAAWIGAYCPLWEASLDRLDSFLALPQAIAEPKVRHGRYKRRFHRGGRVRLRPRRQGATRSGPGGVERGLRCGAASSIARSRRASGSSR